MLANGTLWTKDMEMRLTDNDVVLLDGETQVSWINPGFWKCTSPPLRVGSSVWVWVGAGLSLALREGWVDTFLESWSGPDGLPPLPWVGSRVWVGAG